MLAIVQQKTNELDEGVQVGRAAKLREKPIWDANLPVKEQQEKISFCSKRFKSNKSDNVANYFFSSTNNNDTQSFKR